MITGILTGSPITGTIKGSPITGALCDGLPDGFTRQVVTGTASSVAVPDGAYGARFITDGAAVTKYQPRWTQTNQLFNFDGCTNRTNLNTVGGSYTHKNGSVVDFVITRSGEKEFSLTCSSVSTTIWLTYTFSCSSGDYLYIDGLPEVTGVNIRLYGVNSSEYYQYDRVLQMSQDITSVWFRINSSAQCDNVTFSPQIRNLTTMFGAGNEPTTLEECRKYFPLQPYAYDAGTDSTTAITPDADNYLPVCGGSFSFFDSSEAAAETTYTIEFIGRLTE